MEGAGGGGHGRSGYRRSGYRSVSFYTRSRGYRRSGRRCGGRRRRAATGRKPRLTKFAGPSESRDSDPCQGHEAAWPQRPGFSAGLAPPNDPEAERGGPIGAIGAHPPGLGRSPRGGLAASGPSRVIQGQSALVMRLVVVHVHCTPVPLHCRKASSADRSRSAESSESALRRARTSESALRRARTRGLRDSAPASNRAAFRRRGAPPLRRRGALPSGGVRRSQESLNSCSLKRL